MRTGKKVFLGCSFGAIGGIVTFVVAAVLFILFGISALTGAYFNNPWDRAKLRSMCDPVKDVPSVIESHRAKHGHYPQTIADLDPALPGAAEAISAFSRASGFRYSPHETGYNIYKKLNWDGGVGYRSSDPRWTYAIHDDIAWSIY